MLRSQRYKARFAGCGQVATLPATGQLDLIATEEAKATLLPRYRSDGFYYQEVALDAQKLLRHVKCNGPLPCFARALGVSLPYDIDRRIRGRLSSELDADSQISPLFAHSRHKGLSH